METNRHEKSANVLLSNEAIYKFVLTLTNSSQTISLNINGKKSEREHF